MNQSKWVSDVGAFLDRFHQDKRAAPGWPEQSITDLRVRLIAEEYSELTDAWMRRHLPDTVDGILDLIYVLIGTLPALGIDADPVWDAIHSANMAKTGGDRRNDGKILKPKGWTPPDVAGLISAQRRRNEI